MGDRRARHPVERATPPDASKRAGMNTKTTQVGLAIASDKGGGSHALACVTSCPARTHRGSAPVESHELCGMKSHASALAQEALKTAAWRRRNTTSRARLPAHQVENSSRCAIQEARSASLPAYSGPSHLQQASSAGRAKGLPPPGANGRRAGDLLQLPPPAAVSPFGDPGGGGARVPRDVHATHATRHVRTKTSAAAGRDCFPPSPDKVGARTPPGEERGEQTSYVASRAWRGIIASYTHRP